MSNKKYSWNVVIIWCDGRGSFMQVRGTEDEAVALICRSAAEEASYRVLFKATLCHRGMPIPRLMGLSEVQIREVWLEEGGRGGSGMAPPDGTAEPTVLPAGDKGGRGGGCV